MVCSMLSAALLGLHWSGQLDAGEALVGAGTLLLAGVTAWLAQRTSEDVKRGRESVEVGRRGLELQDWPFLVAEPDRPAFDYSPTYDRETGELSGQPEWRCDVTIANYGRGPAIFDGASLKDASGNELVGGAWKVESIHLLGETELVGIGLGDHDAPAPKDGTLTLKLFYRSATGVRYETSHRLEIRPHGGAVRLDFKQVRI
jgi:hypothetical protein